MLFPDAITALRIRLQRPGPWIAALSLPFLILSLAWMTTDATLPRQPLREIAMASGFAWPLMIFMAPMAWQWTADARTRASWLRGTGQTFAVSALLALLITTLVQEVCFGGFSYWADHVLGMSILCTLAGIPIGRVQAGTEMLAQRAEEAMKRAARHDWLAQGEPFSPALLFHSLETFANLALRSPRAAELGLLELASLYRAWLDHSQRMIVTLGEERRLAEQLVRLALHWDPGLKVEWLWESRMDDLRVPPLLLQPPVEAAIEAACGSVGSIRIEAHTQGQVAIVLESSEAVTCPAWPILEERLRHLHGKEARVHARSTPTGWRFEANFPGGAP